MTTINAYAATEAGGELQPFSYDVPDELGHDEVEIDVHSCGICHSDLSMLMNHWEMTEYPFVPGHEIAGVVGRVGAGVSTVKPGDRVGLGWFSRSCMGCDQCMGGDHNLCGTREQTIVGRHGGFADRVRCAESWAVPIPDGVDLESAGPLFCGGITVFNPLVQLGVTPLSRVGVVGIGGLGHLALQFANKWGCEVTAFTSTDAKAEEAKKLGAHNVVSSKNPFKIQALAGTLDVIIVTVNVNLDWDSYVAALAPKGVLHVVGAVPDPIPAHAFALLSEQKSIGGTPLGSPLNTSRMLEFCARHDIKPVIETFPMEDVNAAMKHLEEGKARYRIVLNRN